MVASDSSLGVREDGGNVEALLASDVKEEGVRGLDETLKLVHRFFMDSIGVQEINFHFASKK